MRLPNFLPKEEKFYSFLNDLVSRSKKAAKLMEKITEDQDLAHAKELAEQVREIKRTSKALQQDLSEQLCRHFITPYDREDILSFATILYRSIKLIEKITNRLLIYKFKNHENDFLRMSEIVSLQVTSLESLVKQLNEHNLRGVQKETRVLYEFEDKADEVLEQLISNLCETDLPYQEVLIRKDLYEMFERLTNMYRDGGNLALQIILKHS